MNRLLTLLLLLLFVLPVKSQEPNQEKANYDLAERYSPRKLNRLVFTTTIFPMWFKNSDRFWYFFNTPEGMNHYIVDPVSGTKRPIFDRVKLAAQLSEIVKDPYDAQNIPIGRLTLVNDEKFTFEITSKADTSIIDEKTGKSTKQKKVHGFEYYIRSNELKEIENYKPPRVYPFWGNVSPDKKHIVFSRDYNLYMMDMENFEKARINDDDSTIVETQLTFDGRYDFSFGSGTRDVNATEKEIKRRRGASVAWSPDSKKFAIIRLNSQNVKDLWVINSLAEPRPKLHTYKYHMPGESESPSRHLYVFDVETKKHREINTWAFKDQDIRIQYEEGNKKDMVDSIRHSKWLGDNDKFFLLRTSRDLKRIDLCLINLQNDSLTEVVKERSNTYIDNRPVKLTDNGFIWWSERSGWAHLYHYNLDGKLINQITSGDYHVESTEVVDRKNRVIYFTANGKEKGINPYYTYLYRVNLDGSNLKLLNPGNYDNAINISDNGRIFVNNYSRVDTGPKISLIDNTGKKILDLEETDMSQLFAMGYRYPEKFTIKAADGKTDLYGVMYKPFDFDSTRLYPIIQYVYPGPQTELVNSSWSLIQNSTDRLAQLGFVVITVGNRGGHPSRSKWYHNYGYGNLRDYGLEDKKVVVEKLAARHSFIDINRVAIHGHSGGGFMAAAALMTYPNFYKAAVSSAGNHENNIYNRWWSEKHHGVLEQISEKGDTTFKYSIDRNTALVNNLKGHLLLVTGGVDDNVHPANTYRMVNALIKANKRFEMLVLPAEGHSYGGSGEYFFWKMADFFSKHLLGDYKSDIDIKQLNN